MIHLSRFLIGIRHSRVFRMRNLSGQIIDDIVKKYPKEFTRVGETRDEVALTDDDNSLIAKISRDDIIIESKKLFDWEKKAYTEMNKLKVIKLMEEFLPILSKRFEFEKDFSRIGIIFEFRVPEFEGIQNENFSKFIYDKFINFEGQGEGNEASIRFAYKLQIPEARVNKTLNDYRNVIIVLNQSRGLDEEGKEKNCLFVSADIQRIFDPALRTVDIDEHFNFAQQYLKDVVLPEFKNKGVNINYE